ncbi:hypothetical protein Taro_003438 [Colocasia esculenta]|uniref:N-lysine methyltransferase n=1 Tax=Colocasia esculenta TaxID=4460 RepID=A0A843TNS2_COLES|nr:hypothetical protein [Colocasia esculenta]
MSRRIRAFKRWMTSQGFDFSDALEFADSDADGICVRALCGLREGDLVATIPKRACLTIRTSGAREVMDGAGLAGPLGLSFAIMYERALGAASLWYGYLQLLPEEESVPLVWSSGEVDALLRGTELHKIVKEDKKLLREDWKECIKPLIEAADFELDPSDFGIDRYFAAKSLVSSRSFQIDEYHGSGMVPLADLFNHKTGLENVHFTSVSSSSSDDESDVDDAFIEEKQSKPEEQSTSDAGDSFSEDNAANLEMIVVRDVEAGDEVFNTYGYMGNAALLHRYGFTEPNNPFDIVNIDLNLVLQWCTSSFSSRYARARLSLWRRLNYSGCMSQNSEYFEVASDGEPQFELIALLFIIFIPEEAYRKLNYAADSFKDGGDATKMIVAKMSNGRRIHKTPGNGKEFFLTRNVCGALVALADVRESLYGSDSLEDDLGKLKICCPVQERKLYHSLVLRLCERKILQNLRAYASRQSKMNKKETFGVRKCFKRTNFSLFYS